MTRWLAASYERPTRSCRMRRMRRRRCLLEIGTGIKVLEPRRKIWRCVEQDFFFLFRCCFCSLSSFVSFNDSLSLSLSRTTQKEKITYRETKGNAQEKQPVYGTTGWWNNELMYMLDSLSLSLSLSLSFSLSLSLSRTLSLTHTHTHTLSLSLSPSTPSLSFHDDTPLFLSSFQSSARASSRLFSTQMRRENENEVRVQDLLQQISDKL